MFDTSDLPEFDADAYILIDRRTGQTIASKNAERKLYPASTTKIMTAVLALEMGEMDQLMTASVRAVRDIGPDGSNIGIIAGEKLRLDNLLDALLVRSANETANIIAENICETRDEFITLMNSKAKELGAFNTKFTNASGIHETTHYTTAYDLARIANYAMDNARFREIVAKRSIILTPTNKHSSWDRLNSTNSLLSDDSIRGFAVTGVKTGYHSEAGYCVVASGIDNNDMELLCVVLGVRGTVAGTSAKRFKIASDLLSYGFENFQQHTFIRNNEQIGSVSVLGGDYIDAVDAKSDGTVKMFMPLDLQKWDVSRKEYLCAELVAPVEKGDVVGYVEFFNAGQFAGRVNLTASSDIPATKGGVREIPNRGDTGSAKSAVSLAGLADAAAALRMGAGNGASTGNDNGTGSGSGSGTGAGSGTGVGAGSGQRFPPFEPDPDGSGGGSGAASSAAKSGGGIVSGIFANISDIMPKNINFVGILKGFLFTLLILAVLLSLVRTIVKFIRNRRRENKSRYRGRLRYPPVKGRFRRFPSKGSLERIDYRAAAVGGPGRQKPYIGNSSYGGNRVGSRVVNHVSNRVGYRISNHVGNRISSGPAAANVRYRG